MTTLTSASTMRTDLTLMQEDILDALLKNMEEETRLRYLGRGNPDGLPSRDIAAVIQRRSGRVYSETALDNRCHALVLSGHLKLRPSKRGFPAPGMSVFKLTKAGLHAATK